MHILIENGSWAVRWYEESESPAGQKTKKRKFKVLGPVLPEHKKYTKKSKVPPDIEVQAESILAPIVSSAATTALHTFDEIVKDFFKVKKKKESTMSAYRHTWTRYLQNRIGSKAVASFKIVDVSRLWDSILAANPKLSRQTFAHMRFFLNLVFRFAINKGFYPHGVNPSEESELPEGLPGRKKRRHYTLAEFVKLRSLLSEPLDRALVSLAFFGGLRMGELQGMTWQDWELTGKSSAIIHVRQSVWHGKQCTPKTDSAIRDVHVGSECVNAVEAFRASLGENIKAGFLLGYSHDHPINLDSHARWRMRPTLKQCETCKKKQAEHKEDSDHVYKPIGEWLGWHSFRRSFVTFSSNVAASQQIVSASAGHAHTSTTEIYDRNSEQTRLANRAKEAASLGKAKEDMAKDLDAMVSNATVN